MDDEWFAYLDDFRHALAHRIPLYIPPYRVLTSQVADHQQLRGRETEVLIRGDLEERKRVTAERLALGGFAPCIMHSFEEEAAHPQMLGDFKTIEELAQKMLVELGT